MNFMMPILRIAPIITIPFALGKVFIGTTIAIVLIILNIVATAIIIDHYPGTELGLFGYIHSFFKFSFQNLQLKKTKLKYRNMNYFDKIYIKPVNI